MVERPGRTGHGRGAWKATVVLVAAATLGAACGDDGGDAAGGDGETVNFEATGAFLASASERSAAEPYRYAIAMAVELREPGNDLSFEAPLAEGEVDGAAFEQHLDMTEYVAGFTGVAGGGVSDIDLTVDSAGDAETLYIRAPALGSGAPDGFPDALAELGDAWGRIDLTRLDASLGEVQSEAGTPTVSDPRAILDLVGEAGDVEELGSTEIGGEAVDGLGSTVTMEDLLRSQGLDADEFADQVRTTWGLGSGLAAADFAAFLDEYMTAVLPVEVWVDQSSLVRRVSYTIDLGAIINRLTPDTAGALEAYTMATTVDYTDYGDESIDPSPPPEAEDAVDVTDAYAELIGA